MKTKIFIVEDEPDIVELYKMTFEENGFEVESASSGAQGLEKLRAFNNKEKPKPDIILLDLLLPDITGIEIYRKFKKMDEIKNIPVIILTNYGSGQVQRMEGDKEFEGVDYYIKIDLTPQQLVGIIKKKLNLK